MHSNSSASPPRQVPSWPQPPAAGPSTAMPVPVLRHTSAMPAGDQGPLQQGKVGDDGTDALMAMLMNTGQVDLQQGAQHARRAQPSTPPPRQSSRSASPRPAMHPGLPPASRGHLPLHRNAWKNSKCQYETLFWNEDSTNQQWVQQCCDVRITFFLVRTSKRLPFLQSLLWRQCPRVRGPSRCPVL
jgi:hypothetical protein